jgi:anti-sigma factor RsiW
MAVSETDLELLEIWLDEALSPREADVLRQRVAAEPELATALAELRSQRSLRASVWAALEPTDAATQQMNWRIRGALAERQTRRSFGMGSWVTARVGSVAAACIMLGFFAGWMGHGGNHELSPTASQNTGPAVAVNQPSDVPPPGTPLYVPVRNAYGQVVSFQRFQSTDQAKNFMDNMDQAHGNAVIDQPDDNVKLVSQEKF